MFCRKCGLKIMPGASICKNCGEPVRTAEYCGGFWGITGEKKGFALYDKEASSQPASKPPARERDTVDLTKVSRQEMEKRQEYEMQRERQFSRQVKRMQNENSQLRREGFKSLLLIAALVFLTGFFMVTSALSYVKGKRQGKELQEVKNSVEEFKSQADNLEKEKGELEEKNNVMAEQIKELESELEKLQNGSEENKEKDKDKEAQQQNNNSVKTAPTNGANPGSEPGGNGN